MKYELLYHFISPVTGAIKLEKGYIAIGDERGFGYPSPILKYLKNDFLQLKKEVDDLEYLEYGAINLGNKYNFRTPTKLGAAVFPLPDAGLLSLFSNIPIPNPTFNPASAGDWIMSGPWLPQIFAGSVDSDSSNPLTKVSSSLAMTQIRTAKNFKLFDHSSFIVANKNVTFGWDNPAYSLAKIDPKLAAVLALYDLGTSYTFTQAQSLGDLQTGLLKNTVTGGVAIVDANNQPILDANGVQKLTDKVGTLSQAISGGDYVDTATIPLGNFVVIDPLYPNIPNRKLIDSTSFCRRRNREKEFDKDPNKIEIFEGPAAVLTKLALTALTAGSLIKISDSFSELVPAVKGTDYVAPDDINTKLNKIIEIVKLLVGVKSTVDFLTITVDQASNLNKIVKTIGGIDDTINMVDTVATDSKLLKVVKNAVGVKDTVDIVTTATKAADVFTNKAGLLELEAQIAALAAVTAISALTSILGFVFTTIGGYEYGQYIRGQSLNVKNRWDETDLNDESHNAVGDFEFRYPSGYNSDSRGKGTLWFDSNGRDPDSDNYYTKQKAKSEGGLRIFSWDSGGDRIGFDSPLAAVHMGLFGYQNKRNNIPLAPNPTPIYKGFVFRCEFNDQGSSDDYRFPTKFGLYDVTRKISSGVISWEGAVERHGWSSIIPIFEYDYNSFNFAKPVTTQKLSISKELVIPIIKKADIPTDMPIAAIFYCPDL